MAPSSARQPQIFLERILILAAPFAILLLLLLQQVAFSPLPAFAAQCGAVNVPWNLTTENLDCDGFSTTAEEHVMTEKLILCPDTTEIGIINGPASNDEEPDPWAGDFDDDGQILLDDITSFLAPIRRFNTSPGDPDYDQFDAYGRNGLRWDLTPGSGFSEDVINIQDITTIIVSDTFNHRCDEASPNPPPATTSWYATGVDRRWFLDKGCDAGHAAASGVIVLAFGQPGMEGSDYGTLLFDNTTFATIDQIRTATFNFAVGYAVCLTSTLDPDLRIAIGTSNNGPHLVNPQAWSWYSHGAEWADMVTTVNGALSTLGLLSIINVWGANDIEPSYNASFHSANWANGYNATTNWRYVNNGSADGCPLAPDVIGPCNNGWDQEDVWYTAWGVFAAYPLPEIYTNSGSLADQWYALSVYSYDHQNGAMNLLGAFTQWLACEFNPTDPCIGLDNDPIEGWAQLYNRVKGDSRTAAAASMAYSSDIERRGEEGP